MKTERRYYEFGNFRLVPDEGVLYQNGVPTAELPNKVLGLLVLFLESDSRVLSQDEIMKALWRDTQVETANLKQSIYLLRKILGDSSGESGETFIKTLPRRGYRFLAPVRVVTAVDNQAAEQNARLVAIEERTFSDVTVEEEIIENDSEKLQKPALASAGRVRPRWQSPLFVGSLSLIFVTALGYGLYRLINRGKDGADNSRKTSFTRLTANGKTKHAAVSPDRKFIAFVIEDEGKQSLWLKNVGAGSESQITLPPEHNSFYSLNFSPDGDYILYGSKATLFKVSVLGDAPKKLLSNYASTTVSFSPDGKQMTYIAYRSNDDETGDIMVAGADGSGERVLASSRRPNLFLLAPVWSPDGKAIACPVSNAAGDSEIAIVRVADGVVSILPTPSSWSPNIFEIVWKPDGSGLLICVQEYRNLLSQIWSLPVPDGAARRVTDDSHNYKSLSLSADGHLLAAIRSEQEAYLWVMPGSGDAKGARQLTSGFEKYDGVFAINWTPAGEIIYESAPSGRPGVWQMTAEGHAIKQLSPDAGRSAVSPDGKFLVYQIQEADQTGLFRVNIQDGEKRRLTTGTEEDPTVSPDGKWVVFTRYGDDVALWKVPSDGSGEAVKLTNFPGYPQGAAISPDGKFIAFYRGPNGGMSFPVLAVIPFDGGGIVKEFKVRIQFLLGANAKSGVQWTPDGQAINYVSRLNGVSNVWRQALDGSPPAQITNFESGIIFNFAFSPDGKRLAISRGTFDRDVVLITNPE